MQLIFRQMERDRKSKEELVDSLLAGKAITNQGFYDMHGDFLFYKVEGGDSKVDKRGKGYVVVVRDRTVIGKRVSKIAISAHAIGKGVYFESSDVDGEDLPKRCVEFSRSG